GPPIMASAGSPGMSRMAIKITVATSHSKTTAAPTRRANHLMMCMYYLLVEPHVVVLRSSNGRGFTHAVNISGVKEVVLLVIQGQHIEILEDHLLGLLVEVSAFGVVSGFFGLDQDLIKFRDIDLSIIGEVAGRGGFNG